MNPVVKFFINRINKGWRKDKVHFDLEDYRNLNEAYWMNTLHRMLSIELSEPQTAALVKRYREENTTVNSALTAAFLGAQLDVQGKRKELSSLGIAGNLRGRLQKPAGEGMGFFAGVVTLDYSYDEKKGSGLTSLSSTRRPWEATPHMETRSSSRPGCPTCSSTGYRRK